MQAGQRLPSLLMKDRQRDSRYPGCNEYPSDGCFFFYQLLGHRGLFFVKRHQTGSMARSVAAVGDGATQK